MATLWIQNPAEVCAVKGCKENIMNRLLYALYKWNCWKQWWKYNALYTTKTITYQPEQRDRKLEMKGFHVQNIFYHIQKWVSMMPADKSFRLLMLTSFITIKKRLCSSHVCSITGAWSLLAGLIFVGFSYGFCIPCPTWLVIKNLLYNKNITFKFKPTNLLTAEINRKYDLDILFTLTSPHH
jgi:hypothetical protein